MSDPAVEKEPGPANEQPAVGTPEGEKKKREYKDFGHEEEKATRELSTDAPIWLSSAH
jgi:H+-transporting ATPase